jgi:hypothetical protein
MRKGQVKMKYEVPINYPSVNLQYPDEYKTLNFGKEISTVSKNFIAIKFIKTIARHRWLTTVNLAKEKEIIKATKLG